MLSVLIYEIDQFGKDKFLSFWSFSKFQRVINFHSFCFLLKKILSIILNNEWTSFLANSALCFDLRIYWTEAFCNFFLLCVIFFWHYVKQRAKQYPQTPNQRFQHQSFQMASSYQRIGNFGFSKQYLSNFVKQSLVALKVRFKDDELWRTLYGWDDDQTNRYSWALVMSLFYDEYDRALKHFETVYNGLFFRSEIFEVFMACHWP